LIADEQAWLDAAELSRMEMEAAARQEEEEWEATKVAENERAEQEQEVHRPCCESPSSYLPLTLALPRSPQARQLELDHARAVAQDLREQEESAASLRREEEAQAQAAETAQVRHSNPHPAIHGVNPTLVFRLKKPSWLEKPPWRKSARHAEPVVTLF